MNTAASLSGATAAAQFGAVMRKNFLNKRRRAASTFCELFGPVLVLMLLVYGFSMSDVFRFDAETYVTVCCCCCCCCSYYSYARALLLLLLLLLLVLLRAARYYSLLLLLRTNYNSPLPLAGTRISPRPSSRSCSSCSASSTSSPSWPRPRSPGRCSSCRTPSSWSSWSCRCSSRSSTWRT